MLLTRPVGHFFANSVSIVLCVIKVHDYFHNLSIELLSNFNSMAVSKQGNNLKDTTIFKIYGPKFKVVIMTRYRFFLYNHFFKKVYWTLEYFYRRHL